MEHHRGGILALPKFGAKILSSVISAEYFYPNTQTGFLSIFYRKSKGSSFWVCQTTLWAQGGRCQRAPFGCHAGLRYRREAHHHDISKCSRPIARHPHSAWLLRGCP